jgi:hypothetical protein
MQVGEYEVESFRPLLAAELKYLAEDFADAVSNAEWLEAQLENEELLVCMNFPASMPPSSDEISDMYSQILEAWVCTTAISAWLYDEMRENMKLLLLDTV